jgi:MYXO-CTERM domain-containing protein
MRDHDRLVMGRGGLVVAALLASLTAPHHAHACGGFFCNRPQNPDDLPVAQTGENVLFAMDRNAGGRYQLEAHIQIFYTGPADKFSWIVPVDGLPTLDTGSNRVFQVLEPATRPRFSMTVQDEGTCDNPEPSRGFGCGGSLDSAKGVSAPGAGTPNGERPEVEVLFKGNVGPYGAVILRSEDAQKLKTWLAENQYYLSDQADKLIDTYVSEQKFFVALRLLSGRGVNEIQPIVLRFEGVGPCVPLRLTAIASVADLQVNLWVLAQNRVVPENFLEINVNEAKIDWLRSGQNYPTLLKQAANEAGGNAFTVEYAGPTTMLRGRLAPSGGFNLSRLRAVTTPPDALDELTRLGLQRDATLLAILRQFIPMPAALRERGVDETTFYNQLRQYWSANPLSFPPFDRQAFADAIDAGIVQPLVKAQALFDNHSKLTRLATFISPEEMSVDPTFIENPSLPDVAVNRQAQGFRMCGDRDFTQCNAPLKVVTPGGRNVWFKAPADGGWCLPPTTPYDRAAVDATPSLEVAWKRAALGEGAMALDNRGIIANAIEMQNAGVDGGCSCSLGGRAAATPILVLAAGLVLAFRRRLPKMRR